MIRSILGVELAEIPTQEIQHDKHFTILHKHTRAHTQTTVRFIFIEQDLGRTQGHHVRLENVASVTAREDSKHGC